MPPEEIISTLNENFLANIISVDDQSLDSDEEEGRSSYLRDGKVILPQ